MFFVILFMGNLCVVLLLLAYKREDSEPGLQDHIKAQLLMTLAYPLGAARLLSDFPLFPVLNSAVTVVGVYYEVRALAGLSGALDEKTKRHLIGSMIVGLIAYIGTAIYTAQPLPRVIVVTLAFFLLMLPVTFIVVKKKDGSRIRLIIGIYLIFLLLAYLFRIFDAVRQKDNFVLFGPSTGEMLMLASMYVYQILGGVGILLLSKEKEDSRLVKLAFYDEETGALNHAGTLEKIGGALEKCATENTSFVAALASLDYVGALDRRLGIERSDKIIARFARKVIELIDKEGMVGRLGGDELFVFIPGADASRADSLAKELIAIPSQDNVGELRYTISTGVASFDSPAGRRISIDSVRASCVEALQEAKRNGPGSKIIINR